MTCNVFGGTLNPTQSQSHSRTVISHFRRFVEVKWVPFIFKSNSENGMKIR